jgi:Zn-dependent oligopeptidase
MASSRILPQTTLRFPQTAEALLKRGEQLVSTHNQKKHDIVAQIMPGAATFENIIPPLTQLENEFLSDDCLLAFCKHVHPDAAPREAAREYDRISGTVFSDKPSISMHAHAIRSKIDELDSESLNLLRDKFGASFTTSGDDSGESNSSSGRNTRDRTSEIRERLAKIARTLEATLANEASGLSLHGGELNGVPRCLIDTLKKGLALNEGQLL